MPAKIRTIKADITNGNYIDPWVKHCYMETCSDMDEFPPKSYAIFEFNKSLNYNGGTSGKLKIYEKKYGCVKVKVKQDLDGDGKFSVDELIYKGKIKGVEDVDALLNFEGTIKVRKQMHSCDWQIQKYPEKDIACTMDYIEENTTLTLEPAGGDPINFPMVIDTLSPTIEVPNINSVGGIEIDKGFFV